MDLNIFDDISMSELMAPSAELSYVQDAKFFVSDMPSLQDNSNSIQSSDAFNSLDVSVRQPHLENLQTPYLKEQVTSGNSAVIGPCALYSQYPGASPCSLGLNKNESVGTLDTTDEFLFDEISRNFEEPKRENSTKIESSYSAFSAENWFPSQQSPQAAGLHRETRDAFIEQIQEGYYPHKLSMIPSVVDQGAEVLAVAAAVKNEHQAQSRENYNKTLVNGENINSSCRKSNTGSGRRRSSKGPKLKLHQRTEPYSDAGMETKRKNAIKAHKNRQKAKEERESMEAEISRLKTLVQEKDIIIQRLQEERWREKNELIRILEKGLPKHERGAAAAAGANHV